MVLLEQNHQRLFQSETQKQCHKIVTTRSYYLFGIKCRTLPSWVNLSPEDRAQSGVTVKIYFMHKGKEEKKNGRLCSVSLKRVKQLFME